MAPEPFARQGSGRACERVPGGSTAGSAWSDSRGRSAHLAPGCPPRGRRDPAGAGHAAADTARATSAEHERPLAYFSP